MMPTNVSMLMTNGSTSKSSSAVSLLSAETEQALLKVNIVMLFYIMLPIVTIATRGTYEDNRETFPGTSHGTK